ncbi:hypothetical protein Q8791_28940 [Nocardiopsis sp. CT-R113]|uniref:Uncharacterized protein n=1 Tax=Nocardiopsis codii TaxID=3065942 RepID=A0ABU7KGB7_9ACTN|nr:hypothetical protein [Nocardiopsis sp. CT-R113]MEE2041258.1 hypothetical protein [Nocardiopsis sp. CT-R113]
MGEAAAVASETDQPQLPAAYTDPITDPDKPKAAPRGTRIPDDFEITDAMRTWASKSAPSCGWSDHESFVDYWRGVPGARGRKLDWVATWRNWMRREHQRHLGGGGSRYPAPASTGRSVTSERAEGWLALGLDNAQGTPHGSQMALPAATAQEVPPWHVA